MSASEFPETPAPQSRPAPSIAPFIAIALGSLLAMAGALAWITARARTALPTSTRAGQTLDDFGDVPAFSLVERSGAPFARADLDGHAWVADFIFTRCPMVCPQMTAKMKALASDLESVPGVRFLSVSVDPETDTPGKLDEYARARGIDGPLGARWLFVTGKKAEIEHLALKGLRVSADVSDPDAPRSATASAAPPALTHSERFILLDARGHVRGWYDSNERDAMEKLAQDARRLGAEAGEAVIAAPLAELPEHLASLPLVNASLNATCAVLLVAGIGFVSTGRIALHKACMVAALLCSAAFLSCYLYYHVSLHAATGSGSVAYQGVGWMRPLYFTILISHVLLAVTVLPLATVTVVHAYRGRIGKHRSIAKVTFPIWLYVSVTGVVVYMMLYHGAAPA